MISPVIDSISFREAPGLCLLNVASFHEHLDFSVPSLAYNLRDDRLGFRRQKDGHGRTRRQTRIPWRIGNR